MQLQPGLQSTTNVDSFIPVTKQVSVEGTLLDVFHTPIVGSTYLANEIFDIVDDGEQGDEVARQGALARLTGLQALYSQEGKADVRALDLIDKAIALVEIRDEDDSEEGDDAI